MSDLITLEENKNIGAFNADIETLEASIKNVLSEDKYNSIVTMENFKAMKTSSQELGKTAKYISDFRIALVKKESVEIKKFEDAFKNLTQLVKDKQEDIKKGLSVFEEQTKQQVLKVCTDYIVEYANACNLRDEFKTMLLFGDMTQTGYMTARGAISSKGRVEAENKVNEKLALQNKVDLRLSNLENECLKANIAVMTKEHVQGFLFDSDEEYNNRLSSLIGIEIKRAEQEKAKIEAEAKAKAEKEAADKVIADQKALKKELEARYQSRIRNATIPQLVEINLELQSYDNATTYELKQQSKDRQKELETPPVEESKIDEEEQQINHIKEIAQEPIKEATPAPKPVAKDGMIKKQITVTFDVEIPLAYGDKVEAVYTQRFEKNIKGATNLVVKAND